MRDYDSADIFADASIAQAPHPYFEHLRAKGPATVLPAQGVVAVTGYDEGLAIFRDDERYSAVNAATGPFKLPFTPEGDDITAQIEAHRDQIPYGSLIVNLDPPLHAKAKGVLNGVITPKRLKENETYMTGLSDRLIDEFIGRGGFEVLGDYSRPFATLVIADLLGVPEEDRPAFRNMVGQLPGQIGVEMDVSSNPLAKIGMYFFQYIEDRRANPRDDVLTTLALQKYPDGALPSTVDVVTAAAFLFGAGQDTTVSLIASLLRFLADDPELQRKLRADHSLIPNFIEETLRLEGTAKSTFRMAKVPVKVGDVEVKPGTTLMLMISALNRDPKKFENPATLQPERANSREHLAFGRGIHACAGAPLARAEAKVTLERFFARTKDIRFAPGKHGTPGARNFEFQPNYLLRIMKELHLEIDPA
jgi:cytochrome P450